MALPHHREHLHRPHPPRSAPAHRGRLALALLSVEQRVAVVLVDMQGWSVAEVARVVGVPPGTVKSRCARARTRLAELLGHLREEHR